jgi:hypothetical protein
MKEKKRFPMCNNHLSASRRENGVGLIVVFLVLVFLQVVGLILLTVTSSGTKVAGSIRSQQQALNAAEAGFGMAWSAIEILFEDGDWNSFNGHYLSEPSGIDDPQADNYFRKLGDLELLELIDPDKDGNPDLNTVVFCRKPYIQNQDGTLNSRYTYTVFLIDDEATGGTADSKDALLVCIGCVGIGKNMTTTRLEIELALEEEG